jgi:hypothetical protein
MRWGCRRPCRLVAGAAAPLWGVYTSSCLAVTEGRRTLDRCRPSSTVSASTPLHASIEYLAWPIVGRARDEPDCTGSKRGLPERLTRQSHHRTRRSLIRNELYPGAAALNRSQKRNSVSPTGTGAWRTRTEASTCQGWSIGSLPRGKPAERRGYPPFQDPSDPGTGSIETAVSDCTSPGPGRPRRPGLDTGRMTAGLLLPSGSDRGLLNTEHAESGSSPKGSEVTTSPVRLHGCR